MLNIEEQFKQNMKDLLETQRIAHIGTWRLNLATSQVVWTEELCKMFGFDPKLPPPPFTEHKKLFTPESWDRLSVALEQTRNVGTPYELELQTVARDGSNGWMWVRGEAERDPEGKITHIWGAAQDITERKKAEHEIKSSEERYRCLFDYSGVGIGYYSTDGHVISFNKKALENMGGKLEDLVGKSFREFFPEEEADKYFSRIEKAVSGDLPQEYEDCLLLESGPKWFFSTFARITNPLGEVIGVQIASIDITERKLAEEALSESQAILKAAFETSPAGIAIADAPDGKLRYVNKAGLLIRDKSEEEIVRNIDIHNYVDSWKILHTDGTPYAEDEVPLARAVLYGETCSEEFIIRRDNHEDRYVLANATPILDSNSKIKAGMVVFLDVTEKRLAEDMNRKQNELLLSLLKLLPVGVFMVDAAEGKPLVANEMGMALLGRGILPDANEQNLSNVYQAYKKSTGTHYPASEMPIVLGMKGVSSHIEDMEVERPDGSRVLLEVFGTPVQDAEGKPWASLVTFMDITERKKAENELIYLSYHDHLTGFYNRRFFENKIVELDKKSNLPLSIIICDINGLKLINDSFGHAYGDELLVKAAETIKAACRPDDFISRIGGDEFAVLLPKTDAAQTLLVANNIKQLASREEVANIELSISYGYDTKTTEKQKMIEIMANAENHMYRHKLYERSSMRSKTIDIIMNTLFEKSNRESMHSNRVSSICTAIASKMNFEKEDINKIRIAGLVHDIGKIGIDEKILNKAGSLSEEERFQVNRHPEIGWRILSSANEFSELAKFILNHHERWDGGGYPNGLKEESIPLESRIIAVADAFDAMTSQRSYRPALSPEEAVAELKRCSGTQFDPEIVIVFVEKVIPESKK